MVARQALHSLFFLTLIESIRVKKHSEWRACLARLIMAAHKII